MKEICYVKEEGWVTEEWLMWEFIKSTERAKEFELFKEALISKKEQIHE